MTIQSDMALLAAGSYWDARQDRSTPTRDQSNRAPIPDGWQVVQGILGSDSNSFLACSNRPSRRGMFKGKSEENRGRKIGVRLKLP